MSNIGFEPQGVYLLVKVPSSYWENQQTLINESTKSQLRKDYISKGDKLEVVVTGSDVIFCKEGDLVAINARGMMELTLEEDEPYFLIRENEVIGKFK